MPNLLEQLSVSPDGAGLDASLAGEVGKLVEIARQAAALRDNPDGIGGFAAALAGLAAPALPDGASVRGGLTQARNAIPAVTGRAAPAALADLARFGTLVTQQLVPILKRSVDAARAIEGIARAQFRCPPEPGPPLPTPPPAPQASGQSRAQAAEARAIEVASRIDQLPSPLSPGGLLDHLVAFTASPIRGQFLPIAVPIVDDILVPLQTVGRWSLATPADIGAELDATLTLLRDRLRAATAGLIDARLAAATALQTPLRATELSTFALAYETAATAMATALEAADPATAAIEADNLDAAITAFEAVRTAQAVDFTPLVPAVAQELSGLPAAIHDRLLHLASQLDPFDAGVFVHALAQPTIADAAAQQSLRDLLAPITDFMEDLGEKLDLSSVEAGVATVATEAQAVADEISGALATVASETRAAFAAVEAAIAGLPLDTLADEMRAGIASAGDALRDAVQRAFAPLRDALAAAIGTISDTVDGLDPQTVTDALSEAVAAITAILQDPAVLSAVEEVRAALDGAVEAAGNLSFAPVTDEVIALIEQMTNGLRALNDTELNDALKGLLDAALAVLPPDLRPVTQPLIDDLGVRIEQGPVALLEDIREKPRELVDKIRTFDPGAVAGDVLGGPFNEAMRSLEAVRPSALIGQLDAALEAEKTRLKDIAAPSRALKPVSDAFDSLLAEMDRLSPDVLLQPIEDAVEEAIRNVVEASPVDEIFAEIEAVFATVQAVLDTITAIGTALDRAAIALASLQNPDAAVDAWRDAALAKIDAAPNAATLDALLGEIAAAVDAARGTNLLSRFDAAVAPLRTALDELGAEAAIARMVALQQRLRPLVRALPAGPERTAIEAALTRFDPLDPAHTGGLRAAALLSGAISAARSGIETQAAELAGLLHGPDGSLTALREGAANATFLRDAVAAEAEKALAPIRYLMAQLGAAAPPIAAVAASVADLGTRLTASLGDILSGPASLQSISDAMQQVVDAIRGIDLAFLREALEGVFLAVRAEIEAAGTKPLIIALDREWGEAVDALDLSLLLPAAEIAALDGAMADLVTKLRGFDPETLIGDAVRPAFEADVLPLVEALDLTAVFNALIEALRSLEEELEAEMARINTAYRALLAARPGGGGTGAGVGLGAG